MENHMTFDQLIRAAESKVRGLESEYEASRARLLAMRERVDSDNPPSSEEVTEATGTHNRLSDRLDDARAELAQHQADRLAQLEVEAAQRDTTDIPDPRKRGTMTTGKTYVVSEPSQYTRDAERTGGPSFLRDLYAVQVKSDPAAGMRLERHGREVEATRDLSQRAGVTTATVASFVPPQYLVDLFAEFARAARPAANLMTSLPLPAAGMSLTIPAITTESTVAVQSSENTEISNQDVADTGIDVDVQTVGGYCLVSRQTLERGVMAEEVIFADLASAYAAQLDTLVLTEALAQTGTNAVTFDSTSPTVVEIWPKLADAAGKVRSQRYTGPTAFVMHPRRWSWLQAALSTEDERPLLGGVASGPSNVMATETNTQYGASVGTLLGTPVVLDGNLPTNLGTGTNQDVILVSDWRDHLLFEDASRSPIQLKFEQVAPQNLSVHLVAYGYSAFSFGRQPAGLSKIGGTGLVTPSL